MLITWNSEGDCTGEYFRLRGCEDQTELKFHKICSTQKAQSGEKYGACKFEPGTVSKVFGLHQILDNIVFQYIIL